MNRVAVAAVLALVPLAGCADSEPTTGDGTGAQGMIAGWVLDAALRPVAQAEVDVDGLGNDTTDDEGRFEVRGNLTGGQYAVVVRAPGHLPTTTVVKPTHPAQAIEVRVQVQPVPPSGYSRLQSFQGFITCEAVVQVGHSHGTGNPDEDDRFACDLGSQDERAFPIETEADPTDMLIEVVWRPSTPKAEFMALALFDEYGDVLVFTEGRSVLRMELGSLLVQDHFGAGRNATLRAYTGIPADDPTEVFVGLSVDQSFDVFVTTFYGQRMPRDYSVTS